jgi:SAM-dependent methyltransferase
MTPEHLRALVVDLAAVGLAFVVIRQCRKPGWLPGRLVLWRMNASHFAVTNWGLGHVSIGPRFTVLDVGCGGGRTIQTLTERASAGKVCGVDYSETSVAVARQINAAAIVAGRVEVQQASVSRLPYADGTFDLVTAVETHYYWPTPDADFREIFRVLKPGGRLALIAETYRGERFGAIVGVAMKLLRARYLTVQQHHDLLTAAGFTEVTVDTEPAKGWICAVGRRPA